MPAAAAVVASMLPHPASIPHCAVLQTTSTAATAFGCSSAASCTATFQETFR